MISTIILTKNAEASIATTLQSTAFSTEVIIIDDYSSDQTIQICKQIIPNVRAFKRHSHLNFAAQRNFALSKATQDWVLFIDADEVITPELQKEIVSSLKSPHKNLAFTLKRLDHFMGQKLIFGETGKIRLIRLAKKQAGLWQRPVHEYWQVSGPTSNLNYPLLHYPHPNVESFLQKINHYTSIEAKYRLSTNESFSVFKLLSYPPAKFIQNYLFKQGYRDGFAGVSMAFIMSLHSLLVRIKLYEAIKSK